MLIFPFWLMSMFIQMGRPTLNYCYYILLFPFSIHILIKKAINDMEHFTNWEITYGSFIYTTGSKKKKNHQLHCSIPDSASLSNSWFSRNKWSQKRRSWSARGGIPGLIRSLYLCALTVICHTSRRNSLLLLYSIFLTLSLMVERSIGVSIMSK